MNPAAVTAQARGHPARTIRTIVFPTDFSENAYQALPYLQLLATTFGGSVHLLHVLPTHGMDDPMLAYWSEGRFQTQAFLEAAWKRLKSEQDRLGLETAPAKVEVRLGEPAAAIDEYAREVGADLIVMGTHTMPWWERLVMGSVTEATVREAPCPVLVVPPHACEAQPGPGDARPRPC